MQDASFEIQRKRNFEIRGETVEEVTSPIRPAGVRACLTTRQAGTSIVRACCLTVAFLGLVAPGLQAQPPFSGEPVFPSTSVRMPGQRFKRLWKMSVSVLAAASVMDVHSSWGRPEVNPLLRGPNGRFGAQGIALKTTILCGVIGAQYFLSRHHPTAAKYGAVTNLVMAGLVSGVAMSNYHRNAGIPRGGAAVQRADPVRWPLSETASSPPAPF
ncbi:MAG: hypothetical protein NZV14_17330 [Bryobacteraceae bacterium]|nr:hypothetical protein [Bryobacteraceae bacterium]MDW8379926.1 hypothetical protein [Bryobacterales bacterium]